MRCKMKKFEKMLKSKSFLAEWEELDNLLMSISKDFVLDMDAVSAEVRLNNKSFLKKFKDALNFLNVNTPDDNTINFGEVWKSSPHGMDSWVYESTIQDKTLKGLTVDGVADAIEADYNKIMEAKDKAAGENESLKRESLERRIRRLERLLK